jgi:hypothetical protein
MTITCPNCGEELEFYHSWSEYETICDCGFHASIPAKSALEPERWEETT